MYFTALYAIAPAIIRPAVRITAAVEELFDRAMNQNFVPVVDDNDSFVGIITRKDIIKYFCKMSGIIKDSGGGNAPEGS